MRPVVTAICLAALAGCTTPTSPEAVDPLETSFTPEHPRDIELLLAGTYWMPMSLGMSTAKGNVAFLLNATGLDVAITLRVGTRLSGIEAPASGAMLMAKLIDATNKTVAKAMVMPPAKDAQIETTNASTGTATLILETHGGSDGQANGDYVAYEITATPRQA